MTSDHIEPVSLTGQPPADRGKATFHKVAANLYRLQATGKYYALLKRGGKQFRRSLKTKDRKLAERRLADLRQKIGNLTISEDTNLSFKEFAKRWLDSVRHKMKPSTITRINTCIKALEPFFGGMTIRNIQRTHCEGWVTERGPKIAAQTFNHELDTMHNIFDYAVGLGLILNNPSSPIERCPVKQAPIHVPTRDQFTQLVAAIRQSDGRLDSQRKAAPGADLVELLAYSGARLQEATSLRWRDVDFDRGAVTIRGPEDIGTKNSEIRTVPMTGALRDLLLRLHQERQPSPEDKIVAIKDAKTTISKACKRLGLPHLHHHDFRHFFATTCIESGVDIPTISRWLGHKDGGALAMRVYGHLRHEHSFEMIKRVRFEAKPTSENVIPLPAKAVG